jgi:uncharacterized DUF497 family protein
MFEWDEEKRKLTLLKHGIDFVDAAEILLAPHIVVAGSSEQEVRKIAIGDLAGITIAVVFTIRGNNYRLITARRARRDEREKYQALLFGRYPKNEGPN